jgi:hypothetical protein
VRVGGGGGGVWGAGDTYQSALVTHQPGADPCQRKTHKKLSRGASHSPSRQKKVMAVPGFEPGSSGSQPLMLTTTLYHHGLDSKIRVQITTVASWLGGPQVEMALLVGGGPPSSTIQLL